MAPFSSTLSLGSASAIMLMLYVSRQDPETCDALKLNSYGKGKRKIFSLFGLGSVLKNGVDKSTDIFSDTSGAGDDAWNLGNNHERSASDGDRARRLKAFTEKLDQKHVKANSRTQEEDDAVHSAAKRFLEKEAAQVAAEAAAAERAAAAAATERAAAAAEQNRRDREAQATRESAENKRQYKESLDWLTELILAEAAESPYNLDQSHLTPQISDPRGRIVPKPWYRSWLSNNSESFTNQREDLRQRLEHERQYFIDSFRRFSNEQQHQQNVVVDDAPEHRRDLFAIFQRHNLLSPEKDTNIKTNVQEFIKNSMVEVHNVSRAADFKVFKNHYPFNNSERRNVLLHLSFTDKDERDVLSIRSFVAMVYAAAHKNCMESFFDDDWSDIALDGDYVVGGGTIENLSKTSEILDRSSFCRGNEYDAAIANYFNKENQYNYDLALWDKELRFSTVFERSIEANVEREKYRPSLRMSLKDELEAKLEGKAGVEDAKEEAEARKKALYAAIESRSEYDGADIKKLDALVSNVIRRWLDEMLEEASKPFSLTPEQVKARQADLEAKTAAAPQVSQLDDARSPVPKTQAESKEPQAEDHPRTHAHPHAELLATMD